MGVTIKMEIELDDDNEGVLSTTMATGGKTTYDEIEFNYKVIDGMLFCAEKADPDYEQMGEITSFEIISENGELGMDLKMVATNHGAVALRTLSIVMVSVFGALTIASGVYILLTRKTVDNVKPEEEQVETKTEE